jgi:branched-chain amino acid transport system permease protein
VSTTEFVLQLAINAFSIGSLYALMAIGLAMVFGILRLINFAHGDMIMVGSFAALLANLAGVPFALAALIGVASSAVAGIILERVAYRPIRGAPEVAMLLTSFAVTVFLENLAILIFQPRSRPFPDPGLLGQTFTFGNLRVAGVDLVSIGVTLVLLVGLTFFVTRTRLGTSMRAVAEDLLAARLVGIRINRVITAAFLIGSAAAGVVGILWSARVGKIDPLMGFYPVLKAFIASVIGGLGSLPGAVLGGYLLGFLEIALQGLLPTALVPYRDAFVFVALVVLLLFRRQGIMGTAVQEGD